MFLLDCEEVKNEVGVYRYQQNVKNLLATNKFNIMLELSISQKDRIISYVHIYAHRNTLSIDIHKIAKLINKYDNLNLEDFAPPILPIEVYFWLKGLFPDPNEVKLWRWIIDEAKEVENEEEMTGLISEIHRYVDLYRYTESAHITEANNLIHDIEYRRRRLCEENNRKKIERKRNEEAQWKAITQIPHNNERNLQNLICEVRRYQHDYPDSDYREDAYDLLYKLYDEIEELKRPKPVTYSQRLVAENLENSQGQTTSVKNSNWIRRIKNLFNKKAYSDYDKVLSSVFAPAEVHYGSHALIQVYLHLIEEADFVKELASETDPNAERRDYIPLQCMVRKGEKIDVRLDIYDKDLLFSQTKSIVWMGSFTKCSFNYQIPESLSAKEMSCQILLSANGIPVGEMLFNMRIEKYPRDLNPEIITHKYNKIFISYAHKDKKRVKSFHEGLKVAGIDHFFDRSYLKAGDIFPEVIQNYIDSADLFVLFWSENASRSDYVEKERLQALTRAFPQVQPRYNAKLTIYPISIQPKAELPEDMKDKYHFGEL